MKKCLFVFLFVFFGSANASILDFEDQSGLLNGTSIGPIYNNVSGGFTLYHFNFSGVLAPPFPPGNFYVSKNQGSTALAHELYGLTLLRKIDSGVFNFLSIDLSTGAAFDTGGFSTAIQDITFTGALSNGGTINQTVQMDYRTGFQTFNFMGFTNVTNVQWLKGGGIGEGLQFDNINVASAASAVPEPATLALLGIGLAGMGFSRKKQAI